MLPRLAALRPDYDHHAAPKVADRDKAPFAIIGPLVLAIERNSSEDLVSVSEIQAAFRDGCFAFDGVEGDLQRYLCGYNK